VTVPPRALITGVSGQDGSYLAELLCAEGVEVHGVARELSVQATANLDGVRGRVTLHHGDLTTPGTLARLVAEVLPGEIYHLAAPTFVPASWAAAGATMRAIPAVVGELLDAVREHAPDAHTVIAGSREMFGAGATSPQREDTPASPTNPYGAGKLAAHQLVGLARAHDGLHVSSAILYNHESLRRPSQYFTRRVARGVAEVSLGLREQLSLGDLDAVRDWSAAVDVVRGMRLMAAAREPADYILASGVGRTVRDLVDVAFACVGLEAEGRVVVDPGLVRPPEGSAAVGDPARAGERLRWSATTSFEALIGEMVAAELDALRDGDR
jgi:GDPmannose 4,6-dehydratase